ncbi:1,4-dihydroxy-2-naphthoate octaprenyltransferase [Ligilactobacillus salitolerans]|uniref:1,4-dihydroxy-2-naphthoate octaprenyltransferase n=1 Tax=Ligilactobacillus salitolerans TaxID=1808352 RepID=A0A401IRQ0_9LACO|nr:prenyltransferase [Ligilactobacillus salitolerans]GBG94212.1 1,4-dihydroxy-2-naphthoate octaprenyltransferase [Ligilactobacillus salitolerans]
MPIPVFLELVEIKAKTASVLPFILGACYSWYNFHSLHPLLLLAFFIAMFLFNMSVDILDNYNDYHHAVDEKNYKQNTNIIGREHLSLKLVFGLMTSMILLATLIGLYLSYAAGWPVLVLGVFCYLVGIFYSSGPRPLSSLPLGELFSGPTMGFMITLICVYINTYQDFTWNWSTVLGVFLISLPDTLWISNLMLANNTCDLDEDEKNQRYTLSHYLGKENSVRLFVIMNVMAVLALVLAVVVKIAPWTVLLSLLVLPVIYKNVRKFQEKQVKKETFSCAVKILAIGSAAQALSYLVYIIFTL